jgi:hypothetical protein
MLNNSHNRNRRNKMKPTPASPSPSARLSILKFRPLALLGLVVLLTFNLGTPNFGPSTCNAQLSTNTPTPPTTPQSALNTALGYFTSFNPALSDCFGSNSFTLWTGAASVQGGVTPLVNVVGGSYDLWRPKSANTNSPTWTALSPEIQIDNSGVAGTVVSAQAGLGFGVGLYDVKATLYVDGLYTLGQGKTKGQAGAEIGLRVFKALGHNFFAGVGLGAQLPQNAQVISAFAGATF